MLLVPFLPSLVWLFVTRTISHQRASSHRLVHTKTLEEAGGFSLRTGGACQDSHVILVDVENLRGKSGFAVTHGEVLTALATWSRKVLVSGRLILVVDHGNEPSAIWASDAEYAVVFAGRSQKADDVLAQDLVPYLSELPQVTVVTADHELIQRCRRASGIQQSLTILPPADLLGDLNTILETSPVPILGIEESVEEEKPNPVQRVAPNMPAEHTRVVLEGYEIKLGGQLLEAETLSLDRGSSNNKRRKKLKLKSQKLREKLIKQGSLVLDMVKDVLEHGSDSTLILSVSPQQRSALLARWEKARTSSGRRREETGDRVVLAEQLRERLLAKYGEAEEKETPSDEVMPPGKAFVLRRKAQSLVFPSNSPLNLDDDNQDPDTGIAPLTMVVVSDTHGFQDDLPLPNGRDVLPDADILLHLGDFAIDDGPVQDHLQKFDQWISKQPHATKIVIRGNHDPKQLNFPISGAICLTRPQSVMIKGYSFYFVPFTRSLTTRAIPRSCDVVVSHVPPKGVLDQHYASGRNVGCMTLKRGASRMKGGPPALWLCGHIHEGRGSTRHSFVNGNDKETLVINAANANPGLAASLDHGPAVVKLYCNSKKGGNKVADIVQMEGQYEYINQRSNQFFRGESLSSVPGSVGELLLAVDLGLKTGCSLFNDKGELIRYQDFQFESSEELQSAAFELLYQWEREASPSADKSWEITRIAIEGGDPPLRKAWHRAARERKALILHVQPEEWRDDLLSGDEKLSGEKAKAASRLIAQQIVADYGCAGMELHQGEFQTDVAEAVLLGLHVSRRLGWTPSRDPAIRRHSSGDILVPKAVLARQ